MIVNPNNIEKKGAYHMKNYKIRVNIEIVECDEQETENPVRQNNGSLTMTISEKDAINIDNCENALLRTSHPAIREAVSKHLSEISKKKFLKKPKQQKQPK